MTVMKNSTSSASPVCSVCIANYNGAEVIEECLNSVFSQECDFPFEVIVHDDASTDGSADIIRNRYPGAMLMPSKENVGFCISNNRMVAQARGKYILLLNNDAALFPDALRILYTYAEEQSCAGILGLPQYNITTRELLDIGSLCDPFMNPVPNLDVRRRDVAMVSGACLWIPLLLWEELGGFPGWFGSLAEDLYLCSLTRLYGYPVRALGTSGFLHHVGKNFGGGKVQGDRLTTTFRRRALTERNKTFVMAICYPGVLLFWLLPLHLMLIHLEGLLLALVKFDSVVWNRIYAPLLPALWRQRHRLLSLRQSAQSHRKASLRYWFAPFCWVPWKLMMLIRHGLPKLT